MDTPTPPTPGTPDMRAAAEAKMGALEKWMAPLFAKLPHLPPNIRESLASIAPWLALIFGILGLVSIASIGGFGLLLSFSILGSGLPMLLAVVVGLLASILDLLAYSPLTKRQKKGWNFLFYGAVLTFAAQLIEIVTYYGSAGGLIGAVIGFWLLFEVRDLYKA